MKLSHKRKLQAKRTDHRDRNSTETVLIDKSDSRYASAVDPVAVGGLVVACVGTYYAARAYVATRKQSDSTRCRHVAKFSNLRCHGRIEISQKIVFNEREYLERICNRGHIELVQITRRSKPLKTKD